MFIQTNCEVKELPKDHDGSLVAIALQWGFGDVEQHSWFQAPFKTHQQKTCFFLNIVIDSNV